MARATNSCTRGMNQCTQCVGWRRRDRGKSSQREGNALFDDFWYFSSLKSTIKEKLLYASSRVVDGADPYKIKSKYNQQTKQKCAFHSVSAQTSPRPPCTFSGRADNACTNLLGFFVHYVRTRGIAEIAESDKTAYFLLCLLPHALATHGSCD